MGALSVTSLIAAPVPPVPAPAGHGEKGPDWFAIKCGVAAAAAAAALLVLLPPTRRWLRLAPLFKKPPPSPVTASGDAMVDLASIWRWDPTRLTLDLKPFTGTMPATFIPIDEQRRQLLAVKQLVVPVGLLKMRLPLESRTDLLRAQRKLRATRVEFASPDMNLLSLTHQILKWLAEHRFPA